LRSALDFEERVNWIAEKSNTTPRAVRELRELFVPSAASYPLIIMRELWLDRAFIVMAAFFMIFLMFLIIDRFFNTPVYWFFLPLFVFLPFFIFYSRSVQSEVPKYKEPNERILLTSAMITNTHRVVYGHTHIMRHEMVGPVEHLNCGTWSPAFRDVACTQVLDFKCFVWLKPNAQGSRDAELLVFRAEGDIPAPTERNRGRSRHRPGAS
jgi:hypothetical protein